MAIDATTAATGVHVMECWIYKGSGRDETYLYLAAAEDWSSVPEPLLAAMGQLQLVMNLNLTPDRPLARANTRNVIAALEQQGYYLQLPPARMPGEGSVQ
jgi:uncharacterized protein YcgL (UPF0745 family)